MYSGRQRWYGRLTLVHNGGSALAAADNVQEEVSRVLVLLTMETYRCNGKS